MFTRSLRIGGMVLAGLLSILIFAVAETFLASSARLSRTYTVAAEPLTIPSDAATIERGRHLAVAATHCTGCHGENLAGQVMVDAPPFRIVSANLTGGKGSAVAQYTDADWIRALRHGVAPDGTSLLLMPSADFHNLRADDLAAIIAYIKSVPPVDSELPTSELKPLGRALLLADKLQVLSAEAIEQNSSMPSAIPAGPTAAYGGYLVSIGGCRSCRGENLLGSVVPDGSNAHAPPITRNSLAGWTEADFIAAMRTGLAPGGKQLAPIMPWRAVGQLSDDELRALWQYLQSQ